MIRLPIDYEQKHDFFMLSTLVTEPYDWKKVFGNSNPIHLEIGSGKGEFLSVAAARNPNINFIGIELKHKRIVSIMKKLDMNIHRNVRLMELFVDESISEKISPGSIACIYIQHPDPWPKRKHIKNRLIQQSLLDCLSGILEPGGTIEVSTDHAGYRDWTLSQFKKREDFSSLVPDGYTYEPEEGHVTTYFEIEKRQEGFEPCFMKYQKVR